LRWRRRRSRQTPGPGRVCDIRTAERYQICQTFHDKAIAPITVHLHIHDECAFVERAEMPEHSIIGQSLELLRRGHYHPSRLVETTGWYQWIGSGPGRDQHFTGIELTKSRTPSLRESEGVQGKPRGVFKYSGGKGEFLRIQLGISSTQCTHNSFGVNQGNP
jgi:hypothetical protein